MWGRERGLRTEAPCETAAAGPLAGEPAAKPDEVIAQMTVTTREQPLHEVAQIASVLLDQAQRNWNPVAQALGPLGTGRLLALDEVLTALHVSHAA